MECYKCHTDENLSIKARRRNGSVRLMICKTCRNEASRKYTQVKPVEEKPTRDMDEWNLKALASYARVLEMRT